MQNKRVGDFNNATPVYGTAYRQHAVLAAPPALAGLVHRLRALGFSRCIRQLRVEAGLSLVKLGERYGFY